MQRSTKACEPIIKIRRNLSSIHGTSKEFSKHSLDKKPLYIITLYVQTHVVMALNFWSDEYNPPTLQIVCTGRFFSCSSVEEK